MDYEAFRADNEAHASAVVEFLGCDADAGIVAEPTAIVQSRGARVDAFVNREEVSAHLERLHLLRDSVPAV